MVKIILVGPAEKRRVGEAQRWGEVQSVIANMDGVDRALPVRYVDDEGDECTVSW